jgi:hypothetical protein
MDVYSGIITKATTIFSMKILIAIIAIACAFTVTANAAGGQKKHKPSEEQKTVLKELLDKYDTNKDGKLEKAEKAKMAKADKKKYREASGHKGQKHKAEKTEK